jgi:hypothetical protein
MGFCLFACRFRFASKLNGDLAFQYFFARQLIDSFLCLFSSLKVDESITDRSVCAWVDRDGGSFTVAGHGSDRIDGKWMQGSERMIKSSFRGR